MSTRGTFVEAVNLLNDNVGGVGVSTTINGVLFKGTAPGQFFEGGESFGDASFVYHGGDPYADPRFVDARAGPTTRSPIRKSITSTTRTRTLATVTAW